MKQTVTPMSASHDSFDALLKRLETADLREQLEMLRDPEICERLRVTTSYTLRSVLSVSSRNSNRLLSMGLTDPCSHPASQA